MPSEDSLCPNSSSTIELAVGICLGVLLISLGGDSARADLRGVVKAGEATELSFLLVLSGELFAFEGYGD